MQIFDDKVPFLIAMAIQPGKAETLQLQALTTLHFLSNQIKASPWSGGSDKDCGFYSMELQAVFKYISCKNF